MKKLIHELSLILVIFSSLSYQETKAQGSNRVDVGKSVANISKLALGGTFNPGDTIEIRYTLAVLTQGSATVIDNVQIFDAVPAKTTYIPGSMRVATNEGVTYKAFTDASDADGGTKSGSNITLNIGKNANATTGGRIKSDSSRPSFYGNTCIMMACYRVRINTTTLYGDTLNILGRIRYRSVSPATGYVDKTFDTTQILIFMASGFCNQGKAISAASDFTGTFGEGTTQNRSTPLGFATSYQKINAGANSPNDYYYAIVNNSSQNGSTSSNVSIPNSNRIFTVWDIGGDHTNAANKPLGNNPVAPGTKGGYFVLVNASYNTNVAYQDSLIDLCPNTYYEFTAWFRNVCARCGCDSTGKGATASGYMPQAGGDSSGVNPNLSFEVDDLVYYNTGDIPYSRTEPWKRYGFSFMTKPGQTSAKFVIRNNSPGGGGNDWAMDDINISHCGPITKMNYNPQVLGCSNAPFVVKLADTVRYNYANSYVHYKWQKSNVGGTVWSDIPGATGQGTTTIVNGLWQFVTTLPAFLATPADSGKYYRVILATSAANLGTDCAYNDQTQTLIKVVNCGNVLSSGFEQFKGKLVQGKGQLSWMVSNEENLVRYELEKGYDGYRFEQFAKVNPNNSVNSIYTYNDDEEIKGNVYYRIKMVDQDGTFKYSSVVVISTSMKLEIKNTNNPFNNKLIVDMVVPAEGDLTLRLYNDKGQVTATKQVKITQKGMQTIVMDNLNCSNGFYVLSADFNNESVKKKLIRVNN